MNAKEAAEKIANESATDFVILRMEKGYVFKRVVRTGRKEKMSFKTGTGEIIEMNLPVYTDRKVAEAQTLPELAEKLSKSGER